MNTALRLFSALAAGTLFSAGLTVSGMTDPQRVRGFLDLFGQWEPTLAFVMGGAVVVMAIAWQVRKHMGHPLFAETFMLPDRTDLDTRLIAGSALRRSLWRMWGQVPPSVPVRWLPNRSREVWLPWEIRHGFVRLVREHGRNERK